MDDGLNLPLDLRVKHFEETLIVTTPMGFTRATGSAFSTLNGDVNIGILHRKPKSSNSHAIDIDTLISF